MNDNQIMSIREVKNVSNHELEINDIPQTGVIDQAPLNMFLFSIILFIVSLLIYRKNRKKAEL